MKKDLAEVKAYAEAMAESNCVWDVYVNKEQDKFHKSVRICDSNTQSGSWMGSDISICSPFLPPFCF